MTYKYGILSSDKDGMKKDIIRKLVYTEAEKLLEFGRAVDQQGIASLEYGFTLPKIERLDPEEIEEGALGDFQKLDWYNIQAGMKKYQCRLMTTDEAKARQQEDIQMQYTMTAVTRGLAWAKDVEIKDSLLEHIGTTVPAEAKWNLPASSNIAGDVGEAIQYVMENTYTTAADIQNVFLYYPAPMWAFLNQPSKPNNYTTQAVSPIDWVQQKYNVTWVPTRHLTNDALLVFKTPETAVHFTYTGGAIPTVESKREYGVGDMWYVTQYYRTYVFPNSFSDRAKNNRIIKISGVA